MKNRDREIVLLTNSGFQGEKAMEREIEQLDKLLSRTESPDRFCTAHELIKRNFITGKKETLMKVFYTELVKPFWFLICKN